MAERVGGTFEHQARVTVAKSSLTGVAMTVLAVTIFSPAGFGGMIGTSLASGGNADPNIAPADNPYANLPAYPSPLTAEEVSDIRGQLASTAASMEFTRAATDDRIEQIRSIAMTDGAVTLTPTASVRVPQLAQAEPTTTFAEDAELRLTLSTPASLSVEAAAQVAPIAISYSGNGGGIDYVQQRDPNLELAQLMFAFER